MRITSLETTPVGLPFREPYVTATGTLEQREMVLLRIEADGDGGIAGWGDAVPLSLRGGASLATVRAALDAACAGVLLGADLDPAAGVGAIDPLLEQCERSGAPPPALAAVDAALLDLLGRVRGEPAWRLLAAAAASSVPCNGTLGAGEPAAVAEAARSLVGAGFRTLKVKVGTGADLERIRAVRSATGPEVALRIDANGVWDLEQATATLDSMEGIGLELAEQPCASLAELAALRRRSRVPIVADESVASRVEAERAAGEGACDAATLKLAKVGGSRAALRIAAALPAYLSSALDSPLGIMAAVHALQALPGEGFVAGLAHGLATSSLFADNVADGGPLLGPTIAAPATPGLGVEVDRDAVERLRIE